MQHSYFGIIKLKKKMQQVLYGVTAVRFVHLSSCVDLSTRFFDWTAKLDSKPLWLLRFSTAGAGLTSR